MQCFPLALRSLLRLSLVGVVIASAGCLEPYRNDEGAATDVKVLTDESPTLETGCPAAAFGAARFGEACFQ